MRFLLTELGRAWLGAISLVAASGTLIAIGAAPVAAQDATWVGGSPSAANSNYSSGVNWTPAVVPTGTATFGASANTGISIGNGVSVGGWTFSSGASAYNFTIDIPGTVTFTGAGITVNGGSASITNNLILQFNNSSAAGAASITNNASLWFYDSSSAGSANITTTHSVEFFNNSSPGSAAITGVGPLANVHFEYSSGPSNDHKLTVGSIEGSGTFSLGQNQLTVGSNNLSTTVDGVIIDGSGFAGGLLVKVGGGTLTLAGTNTYTGGTTISDGTVQVTNNSSVGTGAVTMDGGTFQADGVSDLTFTNSFKINNTAGGSTIDANGVMLTIAGNITDGNGPGKLTVLDSTFGSGTVLLQGINTYSGGTFICVCATLQLGDATHKASLVGDIVNEGRFNIVNANTSAITSITNDGGFTTFFGDNTAGAMTIVNKNVGATLFQDSSSAGSANITNRSGGVTLFGLPGGTDTSTAGNATILNNDGGTIFSAQTNAGTAQITNRNGGGTIFGDQSSAASATIVNNNGGFTSFGQAFGTDTATAGNAKITNNSGGETDFNAFTTAGNATITTNSGGATFFYDNSSGGNAQFITNGTGFVDFSDSVGRSGNGLITAGSIAGSGTYYIGVGNTLVVGSNNLSTEVSGVIADAPCGCRGAGSGNLEKVGSGTMILSGDNTYTGTTTVNGGILQVDGSIASSSLTTVNAGGALTGTGTVGNTTIASGGIFAPGNGTPGSFTTVSANFHRTANLAFQSGALYLVQLNSTTSTFANVIGTATLSGLVGATFAPGSSVMKQYSILTAAGGISGSFDGVATTSAPGGLVATLSYDANHAYINFALDFGAKSNLNVNQQNVGTTLINFFNANGGIAYAFASLTPGGLTQASGETVTGSQQATFDAMSQFLGLLTDPFIEGRGGAGGNAGATPFADEGANAYAANKQDSARSAFAQFATKADVARNDLFDPRWGVWGAAYGGGSNTNGNAALGSNSATARAFGFAAGADYRISPATLVGFALAGGGTNFGVSGFGSGRSDLFQAGAFVRHNVGAAYVTAAAAYGWQDVTTDRTVTIAGVDHLRAEFNANAYSGRVEGGYRFTTPWMGITPYAAGQFTTFSLPAYAEQVLSGAGTFALNYAAKDVTASRSELGVRTDKSFAMENAILTLRGRLAWAHDFNADRNVTALFQTLPGTAFVVNGAAQAHDSALMTASAEMKWLNGWSAAATFEGQFSNVTNSYAGKGVMRYSW